MQDCFYTYNAANKIFLSAGVHPFTFLGQLNSNGSIASLQTLDNNVDARLSLNDCDESNSIVKSARDEHRLFIVDGDYTMENIVVDCGNVRTGIHLQKGHLTLKNCTIRGDGLSSNTGINILGKIFIVD